MAKTIGPVIKAAREKKGFDRTKAAKLIGISVGYLGHLERSYPVQLSDRVIEALKKRLGVKGLKPLQEAHNRRTLALAKTHKAKAERKSRKVSKSRPKDVAKKSKAKIMKTKPWKNPIDALAKVAK